MRNEEIVERIKAGERDLIERLYCNCLGLIHKAVNRYPPEERDDLQQEGFFALLQAVARYDPEGGASFSTYFANILPFHFFKYLRESGRIKIAPQVYEKLVRLDRCRKRIEVEKGEASITDLSRVMGLSEEEIARLLIVEKTKSPASLQAPIDEKGTSLQDMIPDPLDFANDLINEVGNSEIWDIVTETLPERQANVILSIYRDGKSFNDVSEEMGLTTSSIRGAKNGALEKLKHNSRVKALLDEDIFSESVRPTNFSQNHTSAVEKCVLKLQEMENEILNSLRKEGYL